MNMNRLTYIALAAILISGCGSHEGHHHEHEEHEHEKEASGEISFSEKQQELFGIKTEKTALAPFSEIIKTGGEILPAQGDETTVVAPVSGTVNFRSSISTGAYVRKGEAVASVSFSNLAQGDLLEKARARYEAAKKEYERDSELLKNNIISESHYDKSKLEYEQSKTEYEALSRNASDKGVKAASPFNGYVTGLFVKQGEYVEMGTPVATVSQNLKMQVRADVPERYASRIPSIQDATFTVADGNTYKVSELSGRLLSSGKSSVDGYIPVTFEFNREQGITQGSFVTINLLGKTAGSFISLPVSALTEDQGIYSVFVRLDEDCFLKKEVKILGSDGLRAAVSGLEEGEEVVTEGAMHLKLAQFSAVPSGHNHNH